MKNHQINFSFYYNILIKLVLKITDIHTDDGDLEDVFVELTKKLALRLKLSNIIIWN